MGVWMPSSVSWNDTVMTVAGSKLHLTRGGSGRAVLVLHHDIGTPDRLPFYDTLAQSFDVLVPHHPGWGKSERPEWLRSVRDIAAIHNWMLTELGVSDVSLVGLGFGGWVAAEMASQSPTAYRKLVLVGAMGIKPPQGDILDLAVTGYMDYTRAGFHDQKAFDRVYGAEPPIDQLEMWDICREMSFRIAWKPYMYSQTLPHLLGSVRAPSLVVWGDHDKVVPQSAATVYAKALPNAKLEIVKGCGHCVDMEQPEALAKLVTNFIAK
jgi:pimeloyl-ACP methyl ester carboxylesterase